MHAVKTAAVAARGRVLHRQTTLISCLILLLASLASCGDAPKDPPRPAAATTAAPPTFVGSAACADCHATQYNSWQESHHDLAMQAANADTVLGDFSDTQFEYFDVVSTFLQRDNRYFVQTVDANGQQTEFEVRYTFGSEPLQQYLIEFPDGRLQALTIAWDSRPSSDGGQRWFHLYPDDFIAHDDLLHWTGSEQNWNYMCAECHSTNLDKNYNAATDTFATAWSEINVGCEACHGSASNHVQMAASGTLTSEHGLLLDLDDAGYTTWDMDVQRGIAARSEPRMRPPVQPEACGRCHSRRSVVADDYEYGLALLDTHMPSLLSDPLYYADGQIRGEVYVFGSFLQSKMYQAGVSCTDCHDPHAASLKTQGAVSDVCSTCHLPAKFATRDHHRHAPTEVECVDCHMPSTTYMQVDGRRDHSFRVPRPDLTVATAAPNACNTCHDDRTAQWAAATTSEWYGEPASQHFALAIHAANSADSQANEKLLAVVVDRSMAGIVRATALSLYRSPLTTEQAQSVRNALGDADPLVRVGALRSLSILPPETVVQWAAGLLEDPVRAVRLAAFDAISPIQGVLPATSMRAFERVMQEFVATQAAIAERPEAHANLGNAYAARGDFASAERSYQFALDREPRASAIRVNLADLYRQLGRDAEAEVVLRAGLESDRDNAALHHSLGLLLVRSQRNEEALSELALAAELAPAVPRYIYVYAIALNSLGDSRRALDIIATAAQSFPADFDIGWAHVTFLSDAGRLDAARDAAADLLKRFPRNENALTLLQSFDAA